MWGGGVADDLSPSAPSVSAHEARSIVTQSLVLIYIVPIMSNTFNGYVVMELQVFYKQTDKQTNARLIAISHILVK